MRCSPVPIRQPARVRSGGFSLLEVMIVASILGIIGVIGVGYTIDASKREQSLAVSVELAGWMEGVQRRALGVPGGCLVRIFAARNQSEDVNFGGTEKAPGDRLAQAWPNAELNPNLTSNACAANATFLIPAAGFRTSGGNIFRIAANKPLSKNNVVDFSFTPRGGIDSTDAIVVRVQRAPFENSAQKAEQRRGTYDTCVRIDRTSGMIGLGNGACNANEYDDQI